MTCIDGRKAYPRLDRLTGCPRLEMAALDHYLQHRGDFAFFTIEYVKDLTQLVPPALDFITDVEDSKSTIASGRRGISSFTCPPRCE